MEQVANRIFNGYFYIFITLILGKIHWEDKGFQKKIENGL